MPRSFKVGVLALASLIAPLSLALPASAQEDTKPSPSSSDEGGGDAEKTDTPDKDAKADGKADGEAKDGAQAAAPSDNDPYEKPHETYRFIGMRFRNLIVPEFVLDLFSEGGRTVNVFTFGPEFSTRKDGLELDFALSYADYSMDDTLFKGKSDDDFAFEIVNSSMKIVYFTTDLLYEIPLDKEKGRFSLLIGGGVGLGVVFGDLNRNQATPREAGNIDRDDVGAWQRCEAPGTGQPGFCDGANDHYGSYSEASWVNGGSKPSVFPWISLPQVSFRYKPIKQLQLRADLGFSISGFYFGASAAYGL
ncbi:hypothetical protein [Chondromyces apiculatus]|uniref:Uncharacterized protein n=1 Tax=Chondromyces apiculatus DSM 436 TaxID=1192034 RepID=A0A017THM2_9BACT|nr:hypothetical protein [Chondromyces apiculatus]EYF08071.1 Hypothetical protein CAP_5831 [Chondromyces apiculatus DSM 436]